MMSWPKGIYLEASVLCKLPRDVITAELERLKEISIRLNAPIFIPETSFLEWIAGRKETVSKHITNVESGLSEMSKLFDYVSRITWPKNKQNIIADTEQFTRRIIEKNNIKVIDTPPIDLKRLVSMAVDKIKPFQEKDEKGFRDAVSLFTVLEHAKTQEKGSHVFVAHDEVYKEDGIQDLAKEYNAELIVVPSISEAITTLEEFMKNVKILIATYQKALLREFLLQNVDRISEYIRQYGEFPLSFLNRDYHLGFWPSIEDFEVVGVTGIESVTRGVLPQGTSEGRVKISFTVRTKFNIRVQEPILPIEPRFRHDRRVPDAIDLQLSYLAVAAAAKQTVNKTIELGIPIEGSVLLKKEKDKDGDFVDKYYDLEITGIAIR